MSFALLQPWSAFSLYRVLRTASSNTICVVFSRHLPLGIGVVICMEKMDLFPEEHTRSESNHKDSLSNNQQ